ncbi:MAG: hypothetical protein ACK4NC_07505, partial [Candidatus Gracilibacteria bacterium]
MFFRNRKKKEGLVQGVLRAATQIGLPTLGTAALINYVANTNVRNIKLKELTDRYKQQVAKVQRLATSRLSLIGREDVRRLRLSHRNNYQGFEEYIPEELRKNVSPQPPKQAVEANVPDDSNAVNVQPPEEPVSVEQT